MRSMSDKEFGEIVKQLRDVEKKQGINLSAFGVPYSRQLTYELVEAGKRVSDTLNQKLHDYGWWEIKRKFMAFRLQDGTTDGVLYDTKRDAVRGQSNEFHCAYIRFVGLAQGAQPRECAVFLKYNRDLYDKGFRMPDPDDVAGGRDIIMTAQLRDNYKRILGI
jgi:hypothetical protein